MVVRWWENVRKGRYVYYHCAGYRGKCPELYTREEDADKAVCRPNRALVLPPAVLEWLQDEVLASDVMERAAGSKIPVFVMHQN